MHVLLTFFLGWIATLVPLWQHQVPTFWLWGALSGGALASTVWVASRSAPQSPVLLVAGCAALISFATLFDFWRMPPAFILAQCRADASGGLAADIVRHVKTHWTWFFGTNIAMLTWIWIMPHLPLPAPGLGIERRHHASFRARVDQFLRRRLLQRLALSALMVASMALTMTMFESLARAMQRPMSADGLASAMLSGMALYHGVLQLVLALAALFARKAEP